MDYTRIIGFPQMEIPYELDWSFLEETFLLAIEEPPSVDTLLELDSSPLPNENWINTHEFNNLEAITSGNFHLQYCDLPSMYEDTLMGRIPANAPGVTPKTRGSFWYGGNVRGEVTNEVSMIGPSEFEISSFLIDEEENKRFRGIGRKRSVPLELEEIQKYFDVPLSRAAKEMNVGVTVLKRRCRELNIMRWPHRKLKSLKSLIKNVEELGLANETLMLEGHKRLLEQVPDMELTDRTKKLRQACFKLNYKKRKILGSTC